MAIRLQQALNYLGKDRWEYSVWLDGAPDELNTIDHVRYNLARGGYRHPVHEVAERASGFRLDGLKTWPPAFPIFATAFHRDGSVTQLQHQLQLLYPDGTPAAA